MGRYLFVTQVIYRRVCDPCSEIFMKRTATVFLYVSINLASTPWGSINTRGSSPAGMTSPYICGNVALSGDIAMVDM